MDERIMGTDAARAVGRFNEDGPDGYRAASAPDAPLRATRAEAVEDERKHIEHRIRHFVHVPRGDDVTGTMMIPRESTMRGSWPCDAKCSCGWETRTGGAVRADINRRVAEHKFDVEHGFWTPERKD